MYILKQQSPVLAQPVPEALKVLPDCNASSSMGPALPPGFQPPYQTNPDIHTIAVFVQITWVLWFAFILLMMFRGMYAKCGNGDDNSDSESDGSDSAWREEDSSLPSPIRASKHKRRLKKLEQVAPAQSLEHWRAGKTEEHVETFATVSLTLSCAICLESIEEDEQIRELRCGHIYHANCLELWVEKAHHNCPLCNYDMLGSEKTKIKTPPLSVSRSATRVVLNAAAAPGRAGPAQDVIVQIDDDSDDSDIEDDSDDDDW